mgnify:CR=1 FL=1
MVETTQRGRKAEDIGLTNPEKESLRKFVMLQNKLKKIVSKFHQSPNLNNSMSTHQTIKYF